MRLGLPHEFSSVLSCSEGMSAVVQVDPLLGPKSFRHSIHSFQDKQILGQTLPLSFVFSLKELRQMDHTHMAVAPHAWRPDRYHAYSS